MPPALRVIALPSCSSPGCVIDRPQQLRPPTALSSFGDTLSVLIRLLIGRLAVGEWHQGLGHRGDTDFPDIPFMPFPFHSLSFFPIFHPLLIPALILSKILRYEVMNQYIYNSTLCFQLNSVNSQKHCYR